MATPKNPPVTVRILRGTRIRTPDGDMEHFHPDGAGGPILDLPRAIAAELVSARRGEVIPADKAKDAKAAHAAALKKSA